MLEEDGKAARLSGVWLGHVAGPIANGEIARPIIAKEFREEAPAGGEIGTLSLQIGGHSCSEINGVAQRA
jgi:hypothetical protein